MIPALLATMVLVPIVLPVLWILRQGKLIRVYLIRTRPDTALHLRSDQQFLRLLFILIGSSIGVLVSIFYFSSDEVRTDIRIGVLLASGGAVLGILGGSLARRLCQRPGATRWIFATSVLFLMTILGAILGWLTGAILGRNSELAHKLTATGAEIGLVFGLVLLALRTALSHWKSESQSTQSGA